MTDVETAAPDPASAAPTDAAAPASPDPGGEPATGGDPSPPPPGAGHEGSTDGRAKAIGIGLGVVRLGIGAALVVAPGWAGRIWVGPGADGPGSKVFARALGARDVALGVQILRGIREEQAVGHWITAGFVADAADVTAALIAAKHLTPGRRIAMPLIAGAVGAAGVLSSRLPSRPE